MKTIPSIWETACRTIKSINGYNNYWWNNH